jgi:predicted metal-binding membrane protein
VSTAHDVEATARRPRVPRPVVAAVAGAWALILGIELSGLALHLHHGELAASPLPLPVTLLVFLLAWQVMVTAMMVPSSLPLIRLFTVTSANQPRPWAALAALLAGYGAVWGAFGAIAFTGDMVLHEVAHVWPWLDERPWLIGGSVLVVAGGFQFSGVKDRCLSECRTPAGFLFEHYRRGIGAAYHLGRRHGMSCLGCCWALMLVMFAAGVAALWWMAVLGALMIYEKVGRHGEHVARVAGVAFIALGTVVLLQPEDLPVLLHA